MTDLERLGDVLDGGFALGEVEKDGAPGRIGQGAEDGVEVAGIGYLSRLLHNVIVT